MAIDFESGYVPGNTTTALALLSLWHAEPPSADDVSWDELKKRLDDDRLSDRKLFLEE